MHVAAEVPVRIIIKHGDEVMEDYTEVIPIELAPETKEGKVYAFRLQYLKQSGFTTEEAIFAIAGEIVKDDVVSINPHIKGHNLNADIIPNGKSYTEQLWRTKILNSDCLRTKTHKSIYFKSPPPYPT